MKRGKPLRRNLETQRDWERRSRKPLPQVSARRQAERAARTATRVEVLERAGHRCAYAQIIPEVSCGNLPDRVGLEVDELQGGSHRQREHTNPDECRATCPRHHDYKTAHKRLVLERLEVWERVIPALRAWWAL